jgi:hypothetical protein
MMNDIRIVVRPTTPKRRYTGLFRSIPNHPRFEWWVEEQRNLRLDIHRGSEPGWTVPTMSVVKPNAGVEAAFQPIEGVCWSEEEARAEARKYAAMLCEARIREEEWKATVAAGTHSERVTCDGI